MKVKKPSIGLVPLKIHNHKRFVEISEAINRYAYRNLPVPKEWILELTELNDKI